VATLAEAASQDDETTAHVLRHHLGPGRCRPGPGRRADGPRTAGDDSCLHPPHCGRSREGPRLATRRPLIAVYGRFPAYSGRTPLTGGDKHIGRSRRARTARPPPQCRRAA
jgi:hypothetical protein